MTDRADSENLLRAVTFLFLCISFAGFAGALVVGVAVMLACGVSPGDIAVTMMALAFAGVIVADVKRCRADRRPAPPRDPLATPWPAGNTPSGAGGSFPRG